MGSLSDKIYIGVTNNLYRRVIEHKEKNIPGFTQKYNITKLLYLEETNDVMAALEREKQLKKWRREKKLNLIKTMNPHLTDLSLSIGLDI